MTTTGETVPGVLSANALEAPDMTAIIGVVDGRSVSLSYREWHDRAARVGAALAAQGIGRGQRVIVPWDGDWVPYAVAYVGVLWVGGVAVPVDARTDDPRVQQIMRTCGAVAVAGTLPGGRSTTSCPAWQVGELEAFEGAPVPIAAQPGDVAEVLHTSGTTGRPKPVEATHENLLWAPRQTRRPGVVAHAMPADSNAGQALMLQALTQPGVMMVAHDWFSAAGYVAAIWDHHVEVAVLAPVQAMAICSAVEAGVLDRSGLSSVAVVRSVGASVSPATLTRVASAFFNARVYNTYTLTEAYPATVTAEFDASRPGSVGRPTTISSVRVVTDAGTVAAPGETGHVHLRSDAPPRSSGAVSLADDQGWIATGDKGYFDPDDYLYVVGRGDDVILRGGVRVDPVDIERTAEEHPDVIEACAVGLPHPTLGQHVVCAVRLRANPTASVEELSDWLDERLSFVICPRVYVVTDFPRTSTGKIVRSALATRLEQRPAETNAEAEAVGESSELFGAVAQIWADALHLPVTDVTSESDWVALGGTSIESSEVTSLVGGLTGRKVRLVDLRVSRTLGDYVRRVLAAELIAEGDDD